MIQDNNTINQNYQEKVKSNRGVRELDPHPPVSAPRTMHNTRHKFFGIKEFFYSEEVKMAHIERILRQYITESDIQPFLLRKAYG